MSTNAADAGDDVEDDVVGHLGSMTDAGIALWRQGNVAEAERRLRRAAGDTMAFRELSAVLFGVGRFKDAADVSRQGAGQHAHTPVEVILGQVAADVASTRLWVVLSAELKMAQGSARLMMSCVRECGSGVSHRPATTRALKLAVMS